MLVLLVTAMSVSTTANAATLSNPYQPQTTLEYVAYLQGVLDALQAQTAAQGATTKISSRVETLPAELEYEVELRSTFTIGSLSSVYAWFEYGEGALTKATAKTRISRSTAEDEYVRTISNLRENTVYKYRAVYESAAGKKYYGAIQTFTTNTGTGGVSTGGNSSGSTVSTSKGSLTVDKTSYKYSDSISLTWTVPSARTSATNWVGLFESGSSNREYQNWRYLVDDTRGTISFSPPAEGVYEFRLFFNNSYDDEVTSKKITIRK